MSQQDSFIDEVSEEVRRDRLYALYRKYGWIAALAVVLLVGGAAFFEWQKASRRAAAEAAGDALVAALEGQSAEARAEALTALELPEDAEQRAIVLMLRAGALAEADDTDAARASLEDVAGDVSLPARLRDLATLKAVILSASDIPPADRISRLREIAVPGSPYRLLALEQIALAEIEAGETDTALETLGRISEDADATQDLRRRVSQLIVALGGTPAAT